MKKIKLSALSFFAMLMLGSFLTGCSNNDDSTGTSGVMIRLSDAPGDYKEVNVEVKDVLIKSNLNTDDQGWVSIGKNLGIYNLLELTGGVNVLLADNMIPSGNLGQIRLLLGENNTVVLKDGTTHALKTPSGQQSGLKLKINQNLLADKTYEFLLDFDVEHSIVVETGASDIYNLHPVIRVSTKETSGSIKGTISPVLVGFQVMASVQVGTNTVSAYANEEGVFQLDGLPVGNYTVTITPDIASGKLVKTVTGVVVVNGTVADMGNIIL
ncbi:DUF4382 domain-containing protein [Flavobacterium taihuense]|uniref:DUF4382 domain-containing protein n=1 Tax=Flavobacterium taihuense TaxID=2857508 RepID=A0ABS6XQR4_9FLAO|nr:DUF4382 domain-containing protein [Flavobacterium taihuense]MBW4359010.1 DUF4382 domain-containing protein [Flavobacterium taihuense]